MTDRPKAEELRFGEGYVVPLAVAGICEKVIKLPNSAGEDFIAYVQPTPQALATLGKAASVSAFTFVEGRSGQGDAKIQVIKALRDVSAIAGGQNIPTFGAELPLVGAAYQGKGSVFNITLRRNAPALDPEIRFVLTFTRGRLFTRIQNQVVTTSGAEVITGLFSIPPFSVGVTLLVDAPSFINYKFLGPAFNNLLLAPFIPLMIPFGGSSWGIPIPPGAMFVSVQTTAVTKLIASFHITE